MREAFAGFYLNSFVLSLWFLTSFSKEQKWDNSFEISIKRKKKYGHKVQPWSLKRFSDLHLQVWTWLCFRANDSRMLEVNEALPCHHKLIQMKRGGKLKQIPTVERIPIFAFLWKIAWSASLRWEKDWSLPHSSGPCIIFLLCVHKQGNAVI